MNYSVLKLVSVSVFRQKKKEKCLSIGPPEAEQTHLSKSCVFIIIILQCLLKRWLTPNIRLGQSYTINSSRENLRTIAHGWSK